MKKWYGYQQGINLGGWFSQCNHNKEHYDTFITETDIANVADWGLDHIRIPVDYNLVEDNNGNYLESGFAYIQKAIDWCGQYHLNMILDLHKTAGYSFDNDEKETGFFDNVDCQERFYRLWEEFAKRFGKYRDRLAFELLNEITDQAYCDAWNRIADQCIRRIRRITPDIDIVIGGYWNNNVTAVKDLAMPQDEHIIYTFHCYDPMIFTHQGATWVKDMPVDFRFSFHHTCQEYYDAVRQTLPYQTAIFPTMKHMEQNLDADFFTNLFASAIQTAEARNVPLYCGEYGVIDITDPDEALQWYQCIHSVFEKYSIGRAAWTYKEKCFGLTGRHYSSVLEEIKKYL